MILVVSTITTSILTLAACHALWVRFRVARLHSDLMDLRDETLVAASSAVGLCREHLLASADLILQDLAETRGMNVANLICLDRQIPDGLLDGTELDRFDPIVLEMNSRVSRRLGQYVTQETIGGRIWSLWRFARSMHSLATAALAEQAAISQERTARLAAEIGNRRPVYPLALAYGPPTSTC